MRMEDNLAVWMKLKLAQIMGQKRRCLCLNVKLCCMKAERQEEKKKNKTKPASDYKMNESSVSHVTDTQLFFKIQQVQNKQQGNMGSLFKQL